MGVNSNTSLVSFSVKDLIKSVVEFSQEGLAKVSKTLKTNNSRVTIKCQAVACSVQQIGSLSELLDLWRIFPEMVMKNTDGNGVPLKVRKMLHVMI